MDIDEAYKILKLAPALEFELANANIRGLGTSTRMFVMAALDVIEGKKILIRAHTVGFAATYRTQILSYANAFGTGVPYTLPHVAFSVSTNGSGKYDSIYTDHWRDPIEIIDKRVPGIMGWARYARRKNIGFEIYDRSHTLLGLVTEKGYTKLVADAFVNIQLEEG